MILRAAIVWLAGLVTAVPYAAHRLLFVAPREEYAFLITFCLFWVFGYWGIAGPIIALLKLRALFRAFEGARTQDDFRKLLTSPDAREVAIAHVAAENRVPKWLARIALAKLVKKGLARQPVSGP